MADIEKTIKELKDGLDFKIYDSTCVLLEVSTVSNALELLKDRPKIVQCKDCKFAYRKETNLSNAYECRYPFSIIKENHYGDFFCAYAEPKEDKKDG